MPDISVIILAGGRSSRMGEDKGLMSLYEKPMVLHVIETAKRVSEKIIIIANNSNYEQFGYPVFPDSIKEKGPLAGIIEGLRRSDSEKNIILSCDIPGIGEKLLRYLIQNSDGFQVTVALQNGRIHPLVGVYLKECLPVFETQIRYGTLKVTGSFGKLAVNKVVVDHFPAQMLRNMNNKSDL